MGGLGIGEGRGKPLNHSRTDGRLVGFFFPPSFPSLPPFPRPTAAAVTVAGAAGCGSGGHLRSSQPNPPAAATTKNPSLPFAPKSEQSFCKNSLLSLHPPNPTPNLSLSSKPKKAKKKRRSSLLLPLFFSSVIHSHVSSDSEKEFGRERFCRMYAVLRSTALLLGVQSNVRIKG